MGKRYNEAELIIDLSNLENKNLYQQQENEKLVLTINQKSK